MHGHPHARASAFRQLLLIAGARARSFARHGSSWHLASYVAFAASMALVSIAVGAVSLRADPETSEVLLFAIFAAGISLRMLSTSGGSYDTSRLLHLPVGHRTVLAANVASQALGPSSLVFVALVVGHELGNPAGAALLLVRVLAAGLFAPTLYLSILLLQLVFMNLLSLRRLRDLGTIAASVFVVTVYLGYRTLVRRSIENGLASDLDAIRPFLEYLPTTWAARSLHPLAASEAAAYLGGLVALNLALAGAAVWLQKRAFFSELVFRRRRRAGGRKPRVPPSGRGILPAEIGALVRKDLLTLARDPSVKDISIRQIGFIVVPLVAIFVSERRPEGTVTALIVSSVLLLAESWIFLNQFGLDGRGIVTLLSTPAPRMRILLGKNLAITLLFLPVNLFALAVILYFLDDAPHFPMAAGFAIALHAGLLVAGSVASILFPFPILSRGRRALDAEAAQHSGCAAGLVRVLTVPAALAVAAPPSAVLVWLDAAHGPWSYAASLPITVGYSVLACGTGAWLGGKLLERRELELLEAFTRGPSAAGPRGRAKSAKTPPGRRGGPKRA